MKMNGELGPHQTYTDSPSELELVPDHIREVWDNRIYGDEEDIDEGYFELTHKDGDVITPICGKDKIILIKGEEGSHKSFFTTCLLSSAFTTFTRYTLGFNLDLGGDEGIIHFDTEMDKHEVKGRKASFNKLTEINAHDERYQVYSIADYTWRQRAEMITHVVTNTKKKPGVIFIDQLADLMPSYDVNNTEHAGQVIEWLLAWKRATGAMIIVTMHTNRGGITTNGILGKNVDHKATASFLVKHDRDTRITEVMQHKARKRRINKIKFMQDDRGLPRLLTYQDIF